ncbi:flavin reductase family protein [Pseudonocardia alni]|uniref:flavin reductase family protein n=1 Tax=Pseudonocardia alni TaxID=33907 RepID=UPI0033D6F8C8
MPTATGLQATTTPEQLRRIYGCFPSGVAALCALGPHGDPVGMAVSSFVPVSLDPPLVSVCPQRTSTTWPLLGAAPRIGVSVLGAGQLGAARSLAARTGDRFAGSTVTTTPGGAVLLDDAVAWLECEVEVEHDAGDHTVVLLRALALTGDPLGAPLLFHGGRLRGLLADPAEPSDAA